VAVIEPGGSVKRRRPAGIYVFSGLKKAPVEEAAAGEIVVVSGLDDISVGNTVILPKIL
jgi:GTP-binding protein